MRRLTSVFVFATAFALAVPLSAQTTRVEPDRVQVEKATPFDQGKVRVSIGGGYSNEQFSIGATLGYFVIKGLEASLDSSIRFGSDLPTVGTVGPAVRYIVWQIPKFHPYAGGFYRHWFVSDGFDDRDSVGARAGAIFNSKPVLVEGGIVYEQFLDCDGDNCSDVYPEFSFGITF